jgi:peptide/nickel transport system substrate-binding protein
MGALRNLVGRLFASIVTGVTITALSAPAPSQAATLRIASAFDPATMDPHSLALLYHTRVVFRIYEGLVGRDEQYRLEPALATEWRHVDPLTWRFKLRPGVKFHDGSAFTADDVVFSIERALAAPSQRAFTLTGVTGARQVDPLTVDLLLSAPDAVLPEKLRLVAMMSRRWSVAHGVERAQDYNARQETFAVRNANGTGPFRLERFEPDSRTQLKSNPAWWGRADRRNGNVDTLSFVTIRADATRIAALSAGEVDLVVDPPYQDVERLQHDTRLAVTQITDINTSFLTFDQFHEKLPGADDAVNGGRNPFRDVRVRRAVYQAVNIDLMIQKVLRGQATATGAMFPPMMEGNLPELEPRLRYDPVAARALLVEAGWPQGFDITLECVNVPYRERVCQSISAMLTQVGIRTRLHTSPGTQFFSMVSQGSAPFIEYGWTATSDAWANLNGLLHTWNPAGGGTFNGGRYANPKLDALIDDIRSENDLTRRRALVGTALRLARDDLPYIPLYRRTLNWAMQRAVQRPVMWPDDTVPAQWVTVR